MANETIEGGVVEGGAPDAPGERWRRKERAGLVVRAAATKTVVVEVTRRVKHGEYGKYMNRRKRYAVHDLVGCKVGDRVRIQETRPLSKTKRWRVVERLPKQGAARMPREEQE